LHAIFNFNIHGQRDFWPKFSEACLTLAPTEALSPTLCLDTSSTRNKTFSFEERYGKEGIYP